MKLKLSQASWARARPELGNNITLRIESEVGDITVDTTVFGVGDSRAETAIDDGKCEVDKVTPRIVSDIRVDTTVGEDDAMVGLKARQLIADAAAGVRKDEVDDITGETVDTSEDNTAGVVDEAKAGATEDDENVGVAADVGIVEGDAALNRNCGCFCFL